MPLLQISNERSTAIPETYSDGHGCERSAVISIGHVDDHILKAGIDIAIASATGVPTLNTALLTGDLCGGFLDLCDLALGQSVEFLNVHHIVILLSGCRVSVYMMNYTPILRNCQ